MKPGFWTNSFVLEVADRSEMPSTMYIENYAPLAGGNTPPQPTQPVQSAPPVQPVQQEESRIHMTFKPAGDLDAPESVKFCPNCGRQSPPDKLFCQECGTKLN